MPIARSWAIAGTPVVGGSLPGPLGAVAGLDLFENAAEAGAAGGFERWKVEAAVAKQAFEQRWGIPLGKRVRVQLRGEPREREGLLRVAEEDQTSGGRDARKLRLSLAGYVFPAALIESLSRV
ncbi:MAG: hypothetical protein ACKVY0_25995 [Prosthecobacter sp.]|uniref:hypothetical protein n=1 Tax=Prosthecobacter sp. TaxID=1965333 RepID=UPI0039000C2B